MNIQIARWIVPAVCGLVVAGCITHERTVVRDVARTNVAFESDTAARIFYEAFNRAQANATRTESKTEVSIPIVFKEKERVVTGPNGAFNQAVAVCDSNHDGRITELEAKIYAEHLGKH